MKIKWFGLLLVFVLGCFVYSDRPEPLEPEVDAEDAAQIETLPVMEKEPDVPEQVIQPRSEPVESVDLSYPKEYIPLAPDVQTALFTVCDAKEIDYALALGLIQVESTFIPDAVNSKSGCYGLCQLHPAFFPTGLSPAENVQTGISYLAEQIDRYKGDIPAALTAYNAGYDTGSRDYAEMVLAAAEEWRPLV